MDRSILCPRMRASAADPKVSRLGADKVCPDSGPFAEANNRGKTQMETVALVYIALGALVILTTAALGLWHSRSPVREALSD